MKGTIPSVRISLDELSLGERGLRLDTCMVTATTRVYVKLFCIAGSHSRVDPVVGHLLL